MLCREREDAVTIKGYFKETVPQYPPSIFRSRFKVLPGSFEMLAHELSTHDPFLSNQGDRAYPQTSAWLPFCGFLPPTKEECMSLSDST